MREPVNITLQDKTFEKYIDRKSIRKAIVKMGKNLSKEFKKEHPVFVCVLNGSFMFAADLVREFSYPCTMSFIKLSSYKGMLSAGKVETLIGINEDICNKTVVVVEDIIDSGLTIAKIIKELKKHKPKRIIVTTLFFKPDACKKKVKIDYIGIKIPDKFIVGFGLDYNGMGRNYKNIYIVKQKK
jgi:hypoxanthine phosphoribosyltransferase